MPGNLLDRLGEMIHRRPAPEPAAEAPAAPAQRTYTVAPGDSLSAIAERVYGSASAWPQIFEANRDQIANPDLIYPGQTLRLP